MFPFPVPHQSGLQHFTNDLSDPVSSCYFRRTFHWRVIGDFVPCSLLHVCIPLLHQVHALVFLWSLSMIIKCSTLWWSLDRLNQYPDFLKGHFRKLCYIWNRLGDVYGFFFGLDKRVHLMINCLHFFSFGLENGLIELISTIFIVTFVLWKKPVEILSDRRIFGLHDTFSVKLCEFVSFFLDKLKRIIFLYICVEVNKYQEKKIKNQ